MRSLILGLFLGFASLYGETLDEKAQKKMSAGHYKEAIKAYQELADKDQGFKKGEDLKQLAKAYYKDQEHAKAFETFLEALNNTPPPESTKEMSKDEALIFNQALKIYLEPTERNPEAVSLKLRDLYAGIWRLHPDYAHVGYIVAVAYANLSDFENFFDIFYRSYVQLPDYYLAYKTKGILHIKLFERARTPEEKNKERKEILQSFQEAKKRYPQDASLYRMQIAFSPEADKPEVLERNLNEILNQSIMIPRADLSFYLDQMLAFGKINLAKKFLVKAREWYPYSRTLDAADEMIKGKISEREKNGTKDSR